MSRIQKLRQRKAELVASARALFEAAASDNRPLSEDERTKDDQIEADLKALNLELEREERQAARERELVGRLPSIPAEPVDALAEPGAGFQSFGEFMQAVAYAGMPGHSVDPRLMAALGMSTTVPGDGGFLVQTQWSSALLQRTVAASVLAQRCLRIPIGEGFDGLEAPYVDEASRATGSRWGGIRVYRAAEGVNVTAAKPKLGRFELRLEDLKGLCYVTDRALRDAVSLQAFMETAFTDEFSFVLDDEILRGDGAGRCLGILNSSALVTVAKETAPAQAADTILAENVMKMHSRLLARNMGGAEWYINQEVLPQLYTMAIVVGVGGVPVYMPANGLSAAPFGTLFGRPVRPIEQASGLGDVGDIVIADLGDYVLIEKPATSASSMHVRFIYDEMTFRWTWPINGKPKLASAITPYKATTATTLSPFVTLAAR